MVLLKKKKKKKGLTNFVPDCKAGHSIFFKSTSTSLFTGGTFVKILTIFLNILYNTLFIRLSQDGPYYVIGYGGFSHNNFSSVYLYICIFVYQIFTKLGHMIPLWKGKNPIYFEVIRSKVKVTITINRIFDNRVVST